jgi:hypothetical protein
MYTCTHDIIVGIISTATTTTVVVILILSCCLSKAIQVHTMHIQLNHDFKSVPQELKNKNVSMEGLTGETTPRNGNCQMFPLNMQQIFLPSILYAFCKLNIMFHNRLILSSHC